MSNGGARELTPAQMGVAWAQGTSPVLGALVRRVSSEWPMLQAGITAMQQARRRWISVGDSAPLSVELHHNPARMASVVAAPTPDAWCPLCLSNLPQEEKGVAVRERLVALPNPTPIIRDHVVFAHRQHVAQRLRPALPDLAWLLAVADEDTVFLYNGPTSGASSPYHLHLQAGRAIDLPLTAQASSLAPVSQRLTPWGTVAAVEGGARRFLRLTADDPSLVPPMIEWTLHLLMADGEFPMNLVTWRQCGVVAALFPRSKHRPSCYSLGEDRRIVVSPGSVEMAGLVVLPRPMDWERMDSETLAGIYREVCLDDRAWDALLARLCG